MKFPEPFTPAQQRILDRIQKQDQAERRSGSTDPLRLKALRPHIAQFLYTLVLFGRCRHIAEFGTSAGYSTLHLAAAATRTQGRVHTLDREPQKTAWARQNLDEADLLPQADLFTGTIPDFLNRIPHPLDFVLLDFGAQHLNPHLDLLKSKMAPNALLFADAADENLWETHPDYRHLKQTFDDSPDFLTLPLHMGKHQLLTLKTT